MLPRFTPDRVAAITGIAAADVERLAAMYGAAKKSFIRLGWGMTRFTYGGQALRTVALLPGVTGAYGRYGGGALNGTNASFELNYNAVRKPSGPAATRTINHNRLGEALLELNDPPIRALFIAANNPAVTCPDTAKTRRGLAREDLFTVVHDPFLTMTARYADIVLPATTYLETEDFFRAYGTYYMQYSAARGAAAGRGMVQPEAGADAGRAHGHDRSGVPHVAARDPARAVPRRDRTRLPRSILISLRDAGPISIATKDGQQFRTPSGKLEFYSEALAKQGLPPMPDWQPDPVEATQGAQWPLRLLTGPGYFQSHTAFSGVAFLRQREGKPYCVLHPDRCDARAICATASRCGWSTIAARSGLVLHVRDEVQPGVVLVPGQRPDQRGGVGHGEHAVLGCVSPTWAKAPPIRAPGWTCVPGSAQSVRASRMPKERPMRIGRQAWSSMRAAITSRRSR